MKQQNRKRSIWCLCYSSFGSAVCPVLSPAPLGVEILKTARNLARPTSPLQISGRQQLLFKFELHSCVSEFDGDGALWVWPPARAPRPSLFLPLCAGGRSTLLRTLRPGAHVVLSIHTRSVGSPPPPPPPPRSVNHTRAVAPCKPHARCPPTSEPRAAPLITTRRSPPTRNGQRRARRWSRWPARGPTSAGRRPFFPRRPQRSHRELRRCWSSFPAC